MMSQSNGKANKKSTIVTRPDSSGMVRASRQNRRVNSSNNQKPRQVQMLKTLAPTSFGTTTYSGGPSQQSGKDSITISHRELVGSVHISSTASANFNVLSRYYINPGLADTFPWLSTQAVNWEQYMINNLRYEYVPSVPTTTRGQVVLIPEYDPTDQYPETEQDALNNYGSVSCPLWNSCSVDLDTRAMQRTMPRKFIRADRKAGDLRTYDAGQLFVGVTDIDVSSLNTTIGKIYATYNITLCVTQKRVGSPNIPSETSIFEYTGPGYNLKTTPAWSPAQLAVKYNNLGIAFNPNTHGFRLPLGSFRLDYFISLTTPVGTGVSDYSYVAADFLRGSSTAFDSSAKNVFSWNAPYQVVLQGQEITLSGTAVVTITDNTFYYYLAWFNGSVVANTSNITTTINRAKVVISPA